VSSVTVAVHLTEDLLLHLLTRSITTRKRIRIASDLHFY
jgi:hypothetical protein